MANGNLGTVGMFPRRSCVTEHERARLKPKKLETGPMESVLPSHTREGGTLAAVRSVTALNQPLRGDEQSVALPIHKQERVVARLAHGGLELVFVLDRSPIHFLNHIAPAQPGFRSLAARIHTRHDH